MYLLTIQHYLKHGISGLPGKYFFQVFHKLPVKFIKCIKPFKDCSKGKQNCSLLVLLSVSVLLPLSQGRWHRTVKWEFAYIYPPRNLLDYFGMYWENRKIRRESLLPDELWTRHTSSNGLGMHVKETRKYRANSKFTCFSPVWSRRPECDSNLGNGQ